MNNIEGRTIELSNMIIYILRRWKTIVVAALVGMLLLGAFKYIKEYRAENQKVKAEQEAITNGEEYIPEESANEKERWKKDKELRTKQEKLKSLQVSLRTYERNIEKAQRIIDQSSEYNDNAILMRIDPYNKPIAETGFVVTSLEEESLEDLYRDPMDEIVAAYRYSAASRRLDYRELEKKYNTESRYLKELVSLGSDNTSNIITVRTIGDSEGMARDLMELVRKSLLSQQDYFAKRYRPHTIEVAYESYEELVDQDLLQKQNNNRDTLYNAETDKEKAENSIIVANNDITDITKDIQDLTKEISVLDERIAKEKDPNLLKRAVKFAILGFMAGALVLCCCLGVFYILVPKVRTAADIRIYGEIPILGIFSKHPKAGGFSGIDARLLHLESGSKEESDDSVMEKILITLKNKLCFADDVKCLLITGNVDKNRLKRLIDVFRMELGERVKLICSFDLNASSEELKLLEECDALILVEERDYSRMKDLDMVMGIIRVFRKPVLGCILY